MTSIAQSGLFGFGPQPAKETLAHLASTPRMFRHRAADIDLSAIDDVRIGPGEVGGIPTPTFPYKAGQMVQGGATIYPRLSNYFGWLLQGALGYNSSVATGLAEVVDVALTASAQVDYNTGLTNPTDPSTLKVVATAGGALKVVGAVTITGIDENDAVYEETVYLAGTTPVYTSGRFKTVTAVDLPAQTQAGDHVVITSGIAVHTMTFDQTEGKESRIPWMTFYKYIPGDQSLSDPTTADLFEIYRDCKITGLNFTLPNDGPVTARVDVQGRGWTFADAHPLASGWSNSLEDYLSIPVGCTTGGYIKIPTYSSDDLPVVSCQVSLQNTPLDIRQEKVFGSPDLEDITIVGRALSLDLVVKWKDPTLYRRLYTGSNTGTVWQAKPFVQSLDVLAQAGTLGSGSDSWGLRIQAPSVLFQINGGVRLAGNEAVMARFTGTALAPGSGAYCTFTLSNQTSGYAWPSS